MTEWHMAHGSKDDPDIIRTLNKNSSAKEAEGYNEEVLSNKASEGQAEDVESVYDYESNKC